MSETPRQTLPVGTRIGVYEIRRVLGADHTGITYQAWNQHLNTEMVLKEYFPRGLVTRADDGCTVVPNSESDQTLIEFGLERFLVEAEDLISMEHPNVVRVQNSLQNYGTAYQIMEYEKGLVLEKLIERPEAQLDEDQLKLILLPLLDALEKVHRVGFVHGCINPRTILLKADGEPVLLNFASTRLAMARSCGELTEVLNEAYAPAEQFEAQDSDGLQTDLYALGATMYRCITGKPPVPGRERLLAVNRGEPDPQGPIEMSAASGCSEGFLRCIDMMMGLKAEQRPKSVAEVVDKLSAPGQENVKTVGKTAVKEALETTSAQSLSSQTRSPIPLIVTTALGVVALIATALWYTRQDGSRSEVADLEKTAAIVVADRGDAPESEQIESNVLPSEDHAQGQEIGSLNRESQSGISSQITDVEPESGTGAGITLESVQTTVPDPTAPTAQTASDTQQSGYSGDTTGGAPILSKEESSEGYASDKAAKTISDSLQAEAPMTPLEQEVSSEELQPELSPTAQASLDPQGEMIPESELTAEKSSQISIATGPKPFEPTQAGKEPSANGAAEVFAKGPNSETEGTKLDHAASAQAPQQDVEASIEVSEIGVEATLIEKETQNLVSEKRKKEGDTTEEVVDIAHHTPPESPRVTEVISSLDGGSQGFSGRGDVGSEYKSEEKISVIESSQEEVSSADQMTLDMGTAAHTQANAVQVPLQIVGQHDGLEDLVADRMASAEADLVALRLTTPKGENAMEHYQAILELLPDHSGALAGMQRIVDTYAWMIDNAISTGRLAVAKLYLDRAEGITPGAPSLVRARRSLSTVQTSTPTE